ncbi:MAG: hypothetical protein KatS3mg103_0446 [Phycisphaerales bacterium]|nr:MAG: hypothetical protein KatS3mg103_0446 [Phycisphaerales bacterium]
MDTTTASRAPRKGNRRHHPLLRAGVLPAGVVACGAALLMAPAARAQVLPADGGIRTIAAEETGSVALKAFSRRNEEIIHDQEGIIQLDQAFAVIGPLLGGPDVVQAKWREIRGQGVNVLQFEFRSRDASPFVPAGHMIGDEQAEFLGWEIGLSDPIEFLDFTGDITVTEYKVFVSENGGIDFTVFDFTSSVINPWDGTDMGRVIPLRTPGGPVEYNVMIIEYEYEYTVPAPAGLAVLGLASLAATPRRRRTR